MDSATEGAVLVSFGSSLKPDQMPQEKIQVFIDTFKQLGMKVDCLVFLLSYIFSVSGDLEVGQRDGWPS